MTPELESRLARCRNLPSPPSVAERVLDLAQDPEVELAQLADAVAVDPAITAKILRIANSPLYSRHRKSTNLRQALSLLGLNAAVTLALSFSLAETLTGDQRRSLDTGHLWQRSLLAALCARELGRMRGRRDSEELFLAALLQDLGMLVLDRLRPSLYADAGELQYRSAAVAAFEREHIGADHADVGAWLLRNWGLPDALCQAVRHKLVPGAEHGDADATVFRRCVANAVSIAEIWLTSEPADDAVQAVMHQLHSTLDMDKAGIDALFERIRQRIPETESVFETRLADAGDSQLLLEQAREIMMVRNLQALEETRELRDAAEDLQSRAEELEEQGRRDPLTGLCNRARLDQLMDDEFRGASQRGWPLSVLFIDLDHFKSVNDSYGHSVGDAVLRRSASLIRAATRERDIVGRYGGEEFVVLLPGHEGSEARTVADRILRAFRRARHSTEQGEEFSVTASIGLATERPEAPYRTLDALVQAADRALYRAKSEGRDSLIAAEDAPDG